MQKKSSVKPYVHIKEIHRFVIVFLLPFFVALPGMADTHTFFPQSPEVIRGRVTDMKGLPLPGVTLRIEGLNAGMASDNDGCFSFRLPQAEGVLIVSFVGYKTAKVPFRSGVALEIKLEESVSELDEVQVIAYGTQTKREMTGAMSVVKAAEIKDIPSPSVSNLLQGRVSGMSVVNSTGAPGGGVPSRSG